MKKVIKIGTRRSPLALVQTNLVVDQIKIHYPNINCEIVPIITSGDLIKDKNLYDIGGKALFLKEIENALINDEIDLAVHSLKDVPCKLPSELMICAVLEREDARDVFVCLDYKSIEELPFASKVGTSSVRRKILIQRKRPDLKIVTFRGNVDSRIKKLMQGDVDATILAYSGLKRLGLFDTQYCHLIETKEMLPPVGQGVIAIEIRKNDNKMQEICNKINHFETWELMQAGRAFLEYLDADCKTPIAAYSTYIGNDILTEFMLSDFDGSKIVFHSDISNPKDCKNSGIQAAKTLMLAIVN
ncbi:MAG: hydroxymethylbilane synthase [Candidatus Tisiphia sp.]|jgi:hydroxymethylbilane synthase|uniref:hydroxymethylbilane synthase n=1 Tax=Candidatus Tisiphia endosymbiont of Melanophora roralis TaxID=3066261 RepID=UPI001E7A1AFC|nr:MAG: hydroxymethylbilane synthase [Rickettsia endosymbiont of Cimex lectularius]